MRTERHPDAAKVHRVYVDAGDGRERHVWCGAFNMQAGDIVPLATPGTAMPDGRVIEPKPILGIQSDGMLCSARELGLGDDHAGIVILPAGTPLGVPYGEALGLQAEIVYDLDVTRNRPDCFGYLGVARELAARLGASADAPPAAVVRNRRCTDAPGDRRARRRRSLRAVHQHGDQRRHASASSPDWIAQPSRRRGHAFDQQRRRRQQLRDARAQPAEPRLRPRHASAAAASEFALATDGETMVTLDGVERTLTADDLLICDANDTPIGIGGIMGGLDSEISDTTTTIALEIAWFEPIGIAKTATRLGLRSEASFRFDRGVDPPGMPLAIARFVELLRLTCPDLVVHEGMVDAQSRASARGQRSSMCASPRSTRCSARRCRATRSSDLISRSRLRRRPAARHSTVLGAVVAPRLHRSRSTSSKRSPASTATPSSARRCRSRRCTAGSRRVQARRRQLRGVLLGLGLSEAMPNPFLADDDLVRAGLAGPAVRIVNSLVAEESVLRTSRCARVC